MEPLEILIALNTPAGKADPYPLYNALHEIGEVVEISENDIFVVGYEAINSVLRAPSTRSPASTPSTPLCPIRGSIRYSSRPPTGS
jgi:hypothetical protein